MSEEKIEKIKTTIPELPDARKKKYMENYGISAYISEKIIFSCLENFCEG